LSFQFTVCSFQFAVEVQRRLITLALALALNPNPNLNPNLALTLAPNLVLNLVLNLALNLLLVLSSPQTPCAMATTADIKNGMCINHNGGLWLIIEFLHVKPGKGAAFVRTKLRNLATGRVVDHTFNSGVKIDPVRIETREYQYLYNDDTGYVFMNTDNYEQVSVEKHLINAPEFLKDGVVCLLQFHADEERVLSCELPAHVEVEVTYSEPGIKGDTATNTLKPATVDTGVEVRVPLFVDTGDWIKVDTRTKEYVERVKK
jgi:elongation factor P